jgi:hypothetical protein
MAMAASSPSVARPRPQRSVEWLARTVESDLVAELVLLFFAVARPRAGPTAFLPADL